MGNVEILDFINRRFPENNGNWLYGNCFWFAHILKTRFPSGEIWYEPIIGHFIFKYDDYFYDWRGLFLQDTSVAFKFNKEYDYSLYDRLVKFCIL